MGEPVAWVVYQNGEKHGIDFDEDEIAKLPVGTMFYTAPPKKEWVGLTEQDKKGILNSCEPDEKNYVIAMTEALLKDKNI